MLEKPPKGCLSWPLRRAIGEPTEGLALLDQILGKPSFS
jgi:hypothetical protein